MHENESLLSFSIKSFSMILYNTSGNFLIFSHCSVCRNSFWLLVTNSVDKFNKASNFCSTAFCKMSAKLSLVNWNSRKSDEISSKSGSLNSFAAFNHLEANAMKSGSTLDSSIILLMQDRNAGLRVEVS